MIIVFIPVTRHFIFLVGCDDSAIREGGKGRWKEVGDHRGLVGDTKREFDLADIWIIPPHTLGMDHLSFL